MKTYSVGPRYDLIVVGAGAAGIAAAVTAADGGANVLLLDAAPVVGGTLHLATGQISAAGTTLQRERGIHDSAQAHYNDVMRISKGTAHPGLVHRAVTLAASTLEWLMSYGYRPLANHPVQGDNHEPYDTRRYCWSENGGRDILAILADLLHGAEAAGRLTVSTDSRVSDLIVTEDRVTGVRYGGPQGPREAHASATLLATGGYNGDPETFERLTGHTLYAAASYAFARGDGLELGESVGGWLRGQENYWSSFGSILAHDGYPAPITARPEHRPQLRAPWEIFVNADGHRFMAEDEPSVDRREAALLAQPGAFRHIIFDRQTLDLAPPLIPGWSADDIVRQMNAHPMFHAGMTLGHLAQRIGISESALTQAVTEYNQSLLDEDAFGRSFRPRPIEQPPFYGITVHAVSLTSTTGIAVDDSLRVIRADGSPISGLYAAGEVLGAGMLQGRAFCGGMMVTPALSFGRWLGTRFAASASHGRR